MENDFEIINMNSTSYNNSNEPVMDLNYSSLSFNRYDCSYQMIQIFSNGTKIYMDSEDVREEIQWLCRTRSTIGVTLFWSSIALGIPGNLAAFFTLITMTKSTCTFLIALMSMMDLSSIVFKTAISLMNRYEVQPGDAWCKIQEMVVNFVVIYANWVLVLICVERFVTIRFPLKKVIYLTNKRARYSALALGGALLPICMVFLVTHESSPPGFASSCRAVADMEELERKIELVISALYSYVPAILLFILVGLITMALKHHRKQRNFILKQGQGEGTHTHTNHNGNQQSSSAFQCDHLTKLERSVTGMLLVASVVFLILTVPICILMLLKPHLKVETPLAYARMMLVYTFMRNLTFFSHAVNCYIYFLACKRFRQHMFKRLFSVCRRQPSVARSDAHTMMTALPNRNPIYKD